MSYLAAFKTPHPPKAQISNFKTKESELTHHFMRVDLVVIEYSIILGLFLILGNVLFFLRALSRQQKN
jgi:hypothetical protein